MKTVEKLTLRRKRLKLSQQNVGDMLGISHAAVSDMETGKTNITLKNLRKWARCLGIKIVIKLKRQPN